MLDISSFALSNSVAADLRRSSRSLYREILKCDQLRSWNFQYNFLYSDKCSVDKLIFIQDIILNLRNALVFYKKLSEKYMMVSSIISFWLKVINDFLSSEVTVNLKLCKITKKIPIRILFEKYENYQALLNDIFMQAKLTQLPENEYDEIKDLIQDIATFLNVREYDILVGPLIRECSFTKLITYIQCNMNMLENLICKNINELVRLSELIISQDASNLLTKLRVFISEDLRVNLKVLTFESGKVIYEMQQYDEKNFNVELEKDMQNCEKIFNQKKNKNRFIDKVFLFCAKSTIPFLVQEFDDIKNSIKNDIYRIENESKSNNQKDCFSQVSNEYESVKSCDYWLKIIGDLYDAVEREIQGFHNASNEDLYVDMSSIKQCFHNASNEDLYVDMSSIKQCFHNASDEDSYVDISSIKQYRIDVSSVQQCGVEFYKTV